MSAAPAPRSVPASGFYHCSVKGVGRANGRSVVAAAAYRSGERLEDARTGETFDYRARGGVVESFVIAPGAAPAWARDRARLWNEAERAEPRANGRLATELELALPCELSPAARKQLVQDFLAPLVARHGVAADVAIHRPGEGRDHRNVHAHVLVTHRELGPEGFEEIANRRVSMKKAKGKEKQTEIAGIAATPGDVRAIRQQWEQHVNRAYEQAGLDIRVDHRSHKDRGIEQEATTHLGPDVTGMERRGMETERGEANREITRRNANRREIAALEAEARQIGAEIIDLQTERERREARAAQERADDMRAAVPEAEDAPSPGRTSPMPKEAANQNTPDPDAIAYTELCNAVLQEQAGEGRAASRQGLPGWPKAIELPEPKNEAERQALNVWRAQLDRELGFQPEITFAAREFSTGELRRDEFAAAADAVTSPVPPPAEPMRDATGAELPPLGFSPETIAASSPEEIARGLEAARAAEDAAREPEAVSGGPSPPSAVRSLDSIASRFAASFAAVVENTLAGFFHFFVSEPKLTPEQVHQRLQAAGPLEDRIRRAAAAEAEAVEAYESDWRVHERDRAQQAEDLRVATILGLPATAEAVLGRDEYDRTREAERQERERDW